MKVFRMCSSGPVNFHTVAQRDHVHTGRYDALPSVISDLGGAPKPNPEQRKASFRFMDFLVRSQLLKVVLSLLSDLQLHGT